MNRWKPCTRNYSPRIAVLIVIVLGHAGLLVILGSTLGPKRKQTVIPNQEPFLVTFIDDRHPAPRNSRANISKQLRPLSPFQNRPEEIALSTAPSPVPPIDWVEEAERAAREAVAHQMAKESSPSFGAFPKGMGPPPPNSHKAGDTEHFEGGGTKTWINDRCYIADQRLLGPEPGQTPFVRVCTPRVHQYQDFESWRKFKSKLHEEGSQ